MGLCRLLYLSGHCASGLSVSALSSPEIAFPAISISRACSTCRRARTIVAAVVAGLFPIGILGELVSIGTLLAFVIVCAGILVLRYRSPYLARPFRTPLVPLVPILGIISCVGLMLGLPKDTWLRLIVWMAIGLVIYFTYSRSHSKLGRSDLAGTTNSRVG